MKKIIFIWALLLMYSLMQGQNKAPISKPALESFRLPLELAPSFSGNYGELRATHFHAGLDFRVGGVVGAKIHASGDGFISKISISPVGYGNAIYIQHPDGKTSVYGHMLDFAPEIARWIKKKQYEAESFAININPDSMQFRVKRGDFIGRAGNSGSSGGPHLHFEIRETETQIPLDPVKEGRFAIVDNISPLIRRVNFYSLTNSKFLPFKSLLKSYTEPTTAITVVTDTFYVAVDAIDRMNNTAAKLAVASYNYYLDDEKIFSFSPVAIPFDKGRYVNALVEYSEKKQYGRSMVKSWVEPGNALVTHIKAKNDGLFIINDTKEHVVKIEVLDYRGNRSVRSFSVKRGAGVPPSLHDSVMLSSGKIMPWFIPNIYETETFKLSLPLGSLYSSILFTADTFNSNGTTVWRIGDENIPIQAYGRLSLKASVPAELRDKAVIVVVDKNGKYSSLGGEWRGEYMETSIGSFGKFLVTLDTIVPQVTKSFKDGENITSRKAVKFTISDNLSGIVSYKVYIDGKWILPNFDAKTRSLVVALDPETITKGSAHVVMVTISDNRGNVNTVNTSFIW